MVSVPIRLNISFLSVYTAKMKDKPEQWKDNSIDVIKTQLYIFFRKRFKIQESTFLIKYPLFTLSIVVGPLWHWHSSMRHWSVLSSTFKFYLLASSNIFLRPLFSAHDNALKIASFKNMHRKQLYAKTIPSI